MSKKTRITEAQQFQIAFAIVMILSHVFDWRLPPSIAEHVTTIVIEIAPFAMFAVVAAFTWLRRRVMKKDTPIKVGPPVNVSVGYTLDSEGRIKIDQVAVIPDTSEEGDVHA